MIETVPFWIMYKSELSILSPSWNSTSPGTKLMYRHRSSSAPPPPFLLVSSLIVHDVAQSQRRLLREPRFEVVLAVQRQRALAERLP